MPTETTNKDSDIIESHRNRIGSIREKLRKALLERGHQADAELRIIDTKPAMVFILPSSNNVYIGFGPTGANKAYRGPEADLDYGAAATLISEYVKK